MNIVIRFTRISTLHLLGNKYNFRKTSLYSRRFFTMPVVSLDPSIEGVKRIVNQNDFVVFSLSHCPYCKEVKDFFQSKSINFRSIDIDQTEIQSQFRQSLFHLTSQRTFPNVFAFSNHLGGCDDVLQLEKQGMFQNTINTYKNRKILEKSDQKFDYDVAIIGGGSGGLACAKELADNKKKVALLDFVVPSPMGTTWGLGGTCVNVGCIPKKLMHKAALHGHDMENAKFFGWTNDQEPKHDWFTMMDGINSYIKMLNFTYRKDLMIKEVDYINSYARLLNKHQIQCTDDKNIQKTISAKYIVLATGERPANADIPGKEHCISSDDLFWLKYPPGKTLIVGASYVSLECAGALHGMGYDVTVLVRSIFLRGYDQEMAEKIGKCLADFGVKIIRPAIPLEVECLEPINRAENKPGRLRVKYKVTDKNTEPISEEFNTVMFAIGREACTKNIGLENLGIKLDERNRITAVDNREQTFVENIFAIGDILAGKAQLTPVAIKAGQLLARRLCGSTFQNCDYSIIPTTVFTPIEYGAIGYSEETAKKMFGEDDIDVYHSECFPLEYKLVEDSKNEWFYAKLICRISQMNKVIGFHIVCPNAGEVTQGYTVAMEMGATLDDFNRTIGIHPTVSETFTSMKYSKRESPKLKTEGGC